eukprot:CAMPEP_0174744102 /NCGR_PEP_ID=MMETSP1094-20130205/83341_1 /TAXON_ID=156173 /ORGANISM="Chrysochromulina brevifilum, Strain UTEX LB 985" /LENGTH=165 /DNA_ID=CAMNT_0015948419 /DNA_START=96 /DNA_END=593 /DNA_ORIENTATION=-
MALHDCHVALGDGNGDGNDNDEGRSLDEVDARVLRNVVRRRDGMGAVNAEYVHFHTVCMGVKLAMSAHPRLRNVRIDDLWEEAQCLPRADWQEFVRQRLLAPSTEPRRFPLLESAMAASGAQQLASGAMRAMSEVWSALGSGNEEPPRVTPTDHDPSHTHGRDAT